MENSLNAKKKKVGQIAIKVDLEKAYDFLKWDFIFDTLVRVACLLSLSKLL